MSDLIDVWFISASTGCTCCSEDNFDAGPYATRAAAEAVVESYRARRRLASRYSKTGNYHISEERGELLPDGRVIVEDRVFSEWGREHCR